MDMNPALLTALKLAKEGYGRPDQILHMPADVVLAALEYSTFLGKYETTARELNKQTK